MFLFGSAKNERDNISEGDEREMAETGALLLGLGAKAIESMIDDDELWEIDP